MAKKKKRRSLNAVSERIRRNAASGSSQRWKKDRDRGALDYLRRHPQIVIEFLKAIGGSASPKTVSQKSIAVAKKMGFKHPVAGDLLIRSAIGQGLLRASPHDFSLTRPGRRLVSPAPAQKNPQAESPGTLESTLADNQSAAQPPTSQ